MIRITKITTSQIRLIGDGPDYTVLSKSSEQCDHTVADLNELELYRSALTDGLRKPIRVHFDYTVMEEVKG